MTPGRARCTPRAVEPNAAPSERKTAVRWLVVALVVWAAITVVTRLRTPPPLPPAGPAWQRDTSELSEGQQRAYAQLRAAIRDVEAERARTGSWPVAIDDPLTPSEVEGATARPSPSPDSAGDERSARPVAVERGQMRQQGQAVNYVTEAEGLRWLVLFLEPDPRLPKEPAPPEDDEHHTLSDGTPLHVTLWTQPLTESPPTELVAFPAAEGWVERVRR